MGAVLTGMVGSDDLRVDSPEAQGLCPAEEGRGRDAAATDKVAAIDELPARLRARWGACYACGMGVGGMVLVELMDAIRKRQSDPLEDSSVKRKARRLISAFGQGRMTRARIKEAGSLAPQELEGESEDEEDDQPKRYVWKCSYVPGT